MANKCTCIQSDVENFEGWLSPGGHSSGGRALMAKVRGPRFNPGWLPVFHSSQKIFPSLSSRVYSVLYVAVTAVVMCASTPQVLLLITVQAHVQIIHNHITEE